MKYTGQISTGQFEYLAFEMDGGTAEGAVEAYKDLQEAWKPKVGLGDKEYNAFIDRMLMGETNHVEEYNVMSPEQQKCVQTIKRALKRIEAKQSKHE